MKTKILKFSILTAVLGVALWSCNKEELDVKMGNDIEKSDKLLNFNQSFFDEARKKTNTKFDEEIYTFFNSTLSEAKTLTENNQTYDNSNDRILNENERLVLENYFTLQAENQISFFEVSNYYVNYIDELNFLNKESKDYLIYCFTFMKNLEDNINSSRTEARPYGGGSFDDCWDNCMHDHAAAVFTHGNLVDKVQFLANPGGNVLWWAGSCSWNCW